MDPGKALDKLIAEQVFLSDLEHENDDVPQYSKHIASAWLIVDHLRANVEVIRQGLQGTLVKLTVDGRTESGFGKSPAHAICLAALKIVSYNIEHG